MGTPTDEDKNHAGRSAQEPEAATSPPLDDDDYEDERPDPVRLGILATVLLVLVAYAVWTYLHPKPKPFYAEIPGVSLEGMTPAQRETVLKEANAMQCDCGSPTCHYDVAECRHMEETACDVSLKLAGNIVRKVTGKEPVFTQAMPGGMPGTQNPGAPPPGKQGSAAPTAPTSPGAAPGSPAAAPASPAAASPAATH